MFTNIYLHDHVNVDRFELHLMINIAKHYNIFLVKYISAGKFTCVCHHMCHWNMSCACMLKKHLQPLIYESDNGRHLALIY